jgi:hypothetical protein
MNWLLIPTALAQATIQISSAIPGVNQNGANTPPGAFIANFYQFALLISGILAFGAIVFGGVKSAISAGNPSALSEARQWIWSALLGLLLLGGAYIILNTINPNLINLNLPTLSPLSVQTGGGANTGNPGAVNTPGQGMNTAQVLANFNAAGDITVKPGASVEGLQLQTVQDIDSLEAACKQAQGSCPLVITSGTDSHDPGTGHTLGYKADIRSGTNGGDPNVDTFITSLPKAGYENINGVQVTLYAFCTGTIADERNVPGVTPHWDLSSGGGFQ